MGDSRASDERLPWLETAPAAPTAKPAATRSRTPLLLLLALLVGAAIAVMAFLAGRVTAPAERGQKAPERVTVRLPDARPAPAVPATAPLVPPVVAPTPPVSAQRAERASTPVRRPAARRPSRSDRRGMVPPIERAFPLAPVATAASAPPVARPPAARRRPAAAARGGLVQLGAYETMPLLDASWARLVAAYPYLGTMPRMITGTRLPGRPYYYRLRVAAGSRREARALCDHLHRIGRGCMVVANAK